MSRYIDVDLLKLGINKNDEIFCTPVRPLIIDLIDNIPVADVQSPKVAMKILQSFCRAQESCPKCIFANRKDGSCDINVPDSWTEREE